ncbi:unnamed protein product [Pylaiella littoralis]
MPGAARGAEEEVFETPDIAEDDLERQTTTAGPGSTKPPNKVPDAEVISAVVPPQAAFEVFMGRTYAGAREDMSDVVGTSSSSSYYAALEVGRGGAVYEGDGYHHPRGGRPPQGGGGGSSAGGDGGNLAEAGEGEGSELRPGPRRRRTGESPVQRLVRLREETAMLAEDLEEMAKARQKGGGLGEGQGEGGGGGGGDAGRGGGGGGGGGYSLWSAMAKETEALKRQLALLSGDPRFKHIVSAAPAAGLDQEALQQRLSERVVKALESLREPGDGTAEETAVGAAGAAGGGGGGGENGAGSVTYELFLKEASEARRRFGQGAGEGDLRGAEARIAALERALGGGGEEGIMGAAAASVGKSGERGAPLVDLVASLEKRVSVLQPGRLDVLKQKAQLAKAELDGLAKSRASVTGASSASSRSRNKKVEEAFATLEAWQGVAHGLPALVDRLRALETLHLASASFAQRLEQVEAGQSELEGVLKDTNDGLKATRESSVENVSIVNENMKALDRRLAGVGLAA